MIRSSRHILQQTIQFVWFPVSKNNQTIKQICVETPRMIPVVKYMHLPTTSWCVIDPHIWRGYSVGKVRIFYGVCYSVATLPIYNLYSTDESSMTCWWEMNKSIWHILKIISNWWSSLWTRTLYSTFRIFEYCTFHPLSFVVSLCIVRHVMFNIERWDIDGWKECNTSTRLSRRRPYMNTFTRHPHTLRSTRPIRTVW